MMKGLIMKDLLNLKHYFSKKDIFVLGILVFVITSTLTKYASPIIGAIGLMVVAGYCNTFSISDMQSQWKEYEGILPITLERRVKARFIVCLGLLLGVFLILSVLNFILGNILNQTNYFTLLVLEFIFAYLQVLVALPFSLNKGKNGASYVWCIFLIILIGLYLLGKYNDFSFLSLLTILDFSKGTNIILSFVILVIGTIVSYKSAVHIYDLE